MKTHFVRFLTPQVGRVKEHSLGHLEAGIWHEIPLEKIVREAHPLPIVGQMRWSAATEPPFSGRCAPANDREVHFGTSLLGLPAWAVLDSQITRRPAGGHGPWRPTGTQHSLLPLRINMDPAMPRS